MTTRQNNLPKALIECIKFHGHQCPGLIYGYLVSKEAIRLLSLNFSKDEEIVAVCENDSCAIDALQVMLGTSAGKGNLIIRNYGKNAYTIIKRSADKAFRFSRTQSYNYAGNDKKEFQRLDKKLSEGTAGEKEKIKLKHMKAKDLLEKPFSEIFTAKEVDFAMPPYAPLAPSMPCAKCGEMTMSTKMFAAKDKKMICIPCSKNI